MRVWNVHYGFGTIIQEKRGYRFVRFDLLPAMPIWVENARLIPAEYWEA